MNRLLLTCRGENREPDSINILSTGNHLIVSDNKRLLRLFYMTYLDDAQKSQSHLL